MSERVNLTLDDGTKDKLSALAGSDRRMGEYISAIADKLATGWKMIPPDMVASDELHEIKARLALIEAALQRIERGR